MLVILLSKHLSMQSNHWWPEEHWIAPGCSLPGVNLSEIHLHLFVMFSSKGPWTFLTLTECCTDDCYTFPSECRHLSVASGWCNTNDVVCYYTTQSTHDTIHSTLHHACTPYSCTQTPHVSRYMKNEACSISTVPSIYSNYTQCMDIFMLPQCVHTGPQKITEVQWSTYRKDIVSLRYTDFSMSCIILSCCLISCPNLTCQTTQPHMISSTISS